MTEAVISAICLRLPSVFAKTSPRHTISFLPARTTRPRAMKRATLATRQQVDLELGGENACVQKAVLLRAMSGKRHFDFDFARFH